MRKLILNPFFKNQKFTLTHFTVPLNNSEISDDDCITFGWTQIKTIQNSLTFFFSERDVYLLENGKSNLIEMLNYLIVVYFLFLHT